MMKDIDKGEAINDRDVNDLMTLCYEAKDGVINRDEFLWTLIFWSDHVRTKGKLESLFSKYGKTGLFFSLSIPELKQLLADLNGGISVNDEEVDMVLGIADVRSDGRCARLNLERALTAWYCHVEEVQQKQSCW